MAQGFVVTNNIIVDNGQYGIIEMHDLGANLYSNNIVYGHTNLNIALKNGNAAQNTLIVAPSTVFVNYQVNGSGDYHLKAASPAIDAGTSQGAPADDYDGVARPQGSAFDIGAYEYRPSASGTIALSAGAYTAAENAGAAVITVKRTGGGSGAASVRYATSNGTAAAGSDYTAAGGTLSWADGDSANKTFNITVLDDALVEAGETVNVTLSNAVGAALGTPNSAVFTITNDDTAAIDTSSPTAPGGLYASGVSSSAFALGWTASTDNTGVAGYRLDVSLNSGFSSFVAGYNSLNLGNVTSKAVSGLVAGATYYARLRAYDAAGNTSPGSAALSVQTAQVFAGSVNYYVAATGSDSYTAAQAQNPATPWKTIQKAVSSVSAGATVHVAPGTYSYTGASGRDGAIQGGASGTASARIRYVSDTKWGAKIISSGASAVWYNYGSYVDIEGFDITGDGAGGIYNSGSFCRIMGNHVHNIEGPANCATDPNGGAGIDNTNYSASDNDIIGNVVHDVGIVNCGARSSRVHGIYHSNLRGHIYNNITYHNSGYGIHTWHAPRDLVISNNLTFGNGASGIIVGAGDSPGGGIKADGFVVTNNISMNNGEYGIIEEGLTGTNNIYKNNLIYGNSAGGISLQNGNTHQNTVTADPKFVNFKADGSGDYHLSAVSPAIDKGTNQGAPADDYDGVARPRGSAFEIGAYEYVPSVSTAVPSFINVKDKGAKGDGFSDDTAAIQSAVDSLAAGGTVFVPDGVYMINGIANGWDGIRLKSNMTFRMASGAVLRAIPQVPGHYAVIRVRNASNVSIIGGTVQGERLGHLGPWGDDGASGGVTGQTGHTIGIHTSNNIFVGSVTVRDAWGDGIVVGESSVPVTNLTIANVVADNNRRQGVSITSADGVVIRDSIFKNTNGTLPSAGIDLEPDGNAVNGVKNVQILNSQLINNAGNQLDLYAGDQFQGIKPMSGIVVDGNTLVSNSSLKWGIRLTNLNNVRITNNHIASQYYGITFSGNSTGNIVTGNTIAAPRGAFSDDPGGNTTSGNTVVIDTSPPAAPGGLYASGISSSAFTLGWTASTDNVGVAGYRLDVSLNSGFSSFVAGYNNLDLGDVSSKTVSGLAANTLYYARLRAYDSAGNTSPNSVALSTATRAGPSSSPGTIEFSTGAYAVREQDGGAVITATRSGGS
ncbi:MAG: choice-of-anchor Q domain-containing protein, partial [Elusimicrobiales bacterium]